MDYGAKTKQSIKNYTKMIELGANLDLSEQESG